MKERVGKGTLLLAKKFLLVTETSRLTIDGDYDGNFYHSRDYIMDWLQIDMGEVQILTWFDILLRRGQYYYEYTDIVYRVGKQDATGQPAGTELQINQESYA